MGTPLTHEPDYRAMTFVVIDFEGTTPTGYSPEPIEVATLSLGDHEGTLVERRREQALIRPPEHAPVTAFDTAQTGISPSDVADQPDAATQLAVFEQRLNHEPMLLVAHHAPVEAGILYAYRHACPRLARTPVLDTVTMAKQQLPHLGTYNLDHLRVACKIPRPSQRHRAMPDVEVTTAVFRHLLAYDAGAHWPSLTAVTTAAGRTPRAVREDELGHQQALF